MTNEYILHIKRDLLIESIKFMAGWKDGVRHKYHRFVTGNYSGVFSYHYYGEFSNKRRYFVIKQLELARKIRSRGIGAYYFNAIESVALHYGSKFVMAECVLNDRLAQMLTRLGWTQDRKNFYSPVFNDFLKSFI